MDLKATRIFRVAFGGRLSAMGGAPDTLKVRRERARTKRTAKKDVNPVKYHASWLASVIQRWSVGVREKRVTRAMEANARDWGLLDVLAAIRKIDGKLPGNKKSAQKTLYQRRYLVKREAALLALCPGAPKCVHRLAVARDELRAAEQAVRAAVQAGADLDDAETLEMI